MYSAAAVANAFIEIASQGKPLTHMKVQKLVYITHGWNLALLDRPLFYEEVRAWQYGPVIPDLYDLLKQYGGRPIGHPIPLPTQQAAVEDDSEEMKVLRRVWNSYGKYDATVLSSITHKPGTPWSQTWIENPYGPITDTIIKQHYRQLNEHLRLRQQSA